MLTDKESQVMELFNKGLYDNMIARELHISNGRVAQIRKTATRKLYRFYMQSAQQAAVADRDPLAVGDTSSAADNSQSRGG